MIGRYHAIKAQAVSQLCDIGEGVRLGPFTTVGQVESELQNAPPAG